MRCANVTINCTVRHHGPPRYGGSGSVPGVYVTHALLQQLCCGFACTPGAVCQCASVVDLCWPMMMMNRKMMMMMAMEMIVGAMDGIPCV